MIEPVIAYALKSPNVYCLFIHVKMEKQHVQSMYIWGSGGFRAWADFEPSTLNLIVNLYNIKILCLRTDEWCEDTAVQWATIHLQIFSQ